MLDWTVKVPDVMLRNETNCTWDHCTMRNIHEWHTCNPLVRIKIKLDSFFFIHWSESLPKFYCQRSFSLLSRLTFSFLVRNSHMGIDDPLVLVAKQHTITTITAIKLVTNLDPPIIFELLFLVSQNVQRIRKTNKYNYCKFLST